MRPTEFVCSYFSSFPSLCFPGAQREAHCSHSVRWNCLNNCFSHLLQVALRLFLGFLFPICSTARLGHSRLESWNFVCVNKRHAQLSYWILRGRVSGVFRIPA